MNEIGKFYQIKENIKAACLDEKKVKTYATEKFENLVFEGGGMKGLAFAGSIDFFEQYDLLKHIKRIAGSSAGAIVATALAIGYSSKEITTILSKTNFNNFKDGTCLGVDMLRLITKYGIYKGDAFYKWICDIIEKKTGNANITFREIYEKYGICLVITGSCINKAQTYYFNHENPLYADMPVALANRISMSIPGFWKAVLFDNDLMVDGGLLNNCPLFIFDGKYIGDPEISDEQIVKSKTIGFKLMSSTEKKDYILDHSEEKITNLVNYMEALLNSMLVQIERGYIRIGYWERLICINTHKISTLNFSLEESEKNLLVEEGYIAAKNFFFCKINGIKNELNTNIVGFG